MSEEGFEFAEKLKALVKAAMDKKVSEVELVGILEGSKLAIWASTQKEG